VLRFPALVDIVFPKGGRSTYRKKNPAKVGHILLKTENKQVEHSFIIANVQPRATE